MRCSTTRETWRCAEWSVDELIPFTRERGRFRACRPIGAALTAMDEIAGAPTIVLRTVERLLTISVLEVL
jgi:hypothetical protein